MGMGWGLVPGAEEPDAGPDPELVRALPEPLPGAEPLP